MQSRRSLIYPQPVLGIDEVYGRRIPHPVHICCSWHFPRGTYMMCRCHVSVQWPVNNPVTGLHCFLYKLNRSLDNLSEGLPKKNFDCLIPGAVAQCSKCLTFRHCLTLSLPTHGKTEIAGLGLRNGLPNPYFTKASTSSTPRIRQWPRGV
jgi:hypothetical protein